jgi:hypothetical protein
MRDAPITASLVHGRNSHLPGVRVFGIELSELVVCDCGKWEPPTREQVMITRHAAAVITRLDLPVCCSEESERRRVLH